MENETNISNQPTQLSERMSDVIALNQLVGAIADYYSFKSHVEGDVDEDGEPLHMSADGEPVIPGGIDKQIERAFLCQLKKFSDSK